MPFYLCSLQICLHTYFLYCYRPGTSFSQYGGYLTPHGPAGSVIGMPSANIYPPNQAYAQQMQMQAQQGYGMVMSPTGQPMAMPGSQMPSARTHIPVDVQHVPEQPMVS